MAVHPADDDQLVIEPTSSRGVTSTFLSLSVIFVIVIVACLGVVAYGLLSESDRTSVAASDDQSLRDEVMSQADQFVLRFNTYGPADLDENNLLPTYAERVREVITPKFAVSFDSSVTLAEQSVSQAGYAREVELYATAVEEAGEDTATVLVAGVFSGSYPDSSAQATDDDRVEFEPQPFRIKVMLVRSDGTWLVDDFSPLASEVVDPGQTGGGDGAGDPEDPAAPAPPASEQPTAPPSQEEGS